MAYIDLENEPIEIKAAKIGRNGVIFGAILTAFLTVILSGIFTPIIGRIFLLVDSSFKTDSANSPVTLQINNEEHNRTIPALPRASETKYEGFAPTISNNYEEKIGHEENKAPPVLSDKDPRIISNVIPALLRADIVEHDEEYLTFPKNTIEVKKKVEVNSPKLEDQNKEINIVEENKKFTDLAKKANQNITPPTTSKKPANRFVDPNNVVLQFKNATGIPMVLILDDVSFQGLQRVQNLDSIITANFPADNAFHAMSNFGHSSGSYMVKVRQIGTIIPYQLGVVNIFYSDQPKLTVIKTGNVNTPFQAVIDLSE
jgi:hypothetical protein